MNGCFKIFFLVAILVLAACESMEIKGYQSEDDATGSVDGSADATQVDVPAAATPVNCEDKDGDKICLPLDCNDDPAKGGAAAHPGAAEVCDGIDNNCDGKTDEGLLKKVWTDADQDGYGLNGSEKDLCVDVTLSAGLVLKGGDCNDSPADSNADGKVDGYWIHAHVTETCGDKIDNDCDGKVDEGCQREFNPTFELPGYVGEDFSLKVEWPSAKAGQKIMVVPYYAICEIGKDWSIKSVSKTSSVETKIPDDNACGIRFNTSHGDPANEWLCMGGKVDPTAKISIVTAKGTTIDVTQFVKTWTPPAPEGGCSALLEFHDCK